MDKTNRAYLALASAIIAVSLAAILIRLAQEEAIPSVLIAGGRLIIASLLLTPITLRNPHYIQQIKSLTHRELTLIGIAGMFLALHFVTWVTSLEHTSVLISVVLITTTPIWVALLEIFLLKTTLSTPIIIGLVIAFVGGAIIGLSGSESVSVGPTTNGNPTLGAVLSIIGAIAVAIYMIIGRKMRSKVSLTPYIWMVYGTSAIIMSITLLVTQTPISGYNIEGYGWILALALIPQLIGHTSINYALAYLPATYISLATQLEPIFSSIIAYFLFTEIPSPLQIVGGAIIIVGVTTATLGQQAPKNET